ncbi:hypothetical protein GALMADRAFT_148510 [Galerina marginata CBS 339.88]|uniref:Uncharacterized protein n=1 Tax=Galerina marginata (strain CBS 339.88) TaxID=685588 RepID=A0A067SFV7_GALM3|nr:hypothetical protein GALMADRAFT_148510 [Galerina marginata CBS 339.88]
MPPKMRKKWMHRELEALTAGSGRDASLSQRSGSGSSAVGGHDLDGVFGGSAGGRVGLGIRIEDDLSYRDEQDTHLHLQSQRERERELEEAMAMPHPALPVSASLPGTSTSPSTTATSHPTSSATTKSQPPLAPQIQPLTPTLSPSLSVPPSLAASQPFFSDWHVAVELVRELVAAFASADFACLNVFFHHSIFFLLNFAFVHSLISLIFPFSRDSKHVPIFFFTFPPSVSFLAPFPVLSFQTQTNTPPLPPGPNPPLPPRRKPPRELRTLQGVIPQWSFLLVRPGKE